MEVDFCPVLCILEVPVLQAFRGISHFVWCRNMTDKGFLLKQYNGEFYYQDIAVKEEEFCPVDSEERIPFEETDTDYKQLQLNMNQGIKGI